MEICEIALFAHKISVFVKKCYITDIVLNRPVYLAFNNF